MYMTFRWYGQDDPVPLSYIRQIPGLTGIVSAIYHIPVGEVWSLEAIRKLKAEVESAGLKLSVIESVPVHEDIKMGRGQRERYIQNYCETIANLGRSGIHTVCYNFMPVFDWLRSELEHTLEDGSKTLIYDNEFINKMDPASGELKLPGWDTSYGQAELQGLLDEYRSISSAQLWQNLFYFLERVIPVAEQHDVRLAIHPDDPPWPVFGLPRIITCRENLRHLTQTVPSACNGLTMCAGSLGASPDNNLGALIREFGAQKRIHFAHCRNVKWHGERSFAESSHLQEDGSLDMVDIMRAYHEVGYQGPIRPDHGRMIWGETGKPGYGLYDRALGAVYLRGLWDSLQDQPPSVMKKTTVTTQGARL